MVAAADAVIEAIDRDALLRYYALKNGDEEPNAAARKKENDECKSALIEALEKKCAALLELVTEGPVAATRVCLGCFFLFSP